MDTQQVISALKGDQVIPQFVDEGFQPELLLKFKINDKIYEAGSSIDVGDAKAEPELLVHVVNPASIEALKSAKFLLIVSDPDAPTRNGFLGEARHLLRKDVTLGAADESGLYKLDLSEPAINRYVPPAPPPLTGPHRYIYLLYRQPEDLTKVMAGLGSKLTQRARWNSKKWSTEHGLELIGATFHTSQFKGACTIS